VFLIQNGSLEAQRTLGDIFLKTVNLTPFTAALRKQSFHNMDTVDDGDNLSFEETDLEALRISVAKRYNSGTLNDGTIVTKKTTITTAIDDFIQGSLRMITFIKYFREGSSIFGLFLLLITIFLAQGLYMFLDYWMALWILDSSSLEENSSRPIIYVALTAGTLLIAIQRSVWVFSVLIASSNSLFNRMTKTVLETNMNFFKVNGQGKII
jgi:ABC-type multidrug transport system fused ATPase/permease subunit